MSELEVKNALIIAEPITAIAVYQTQGGVDSVLNKIKAEVKSIVLDISTPAGRKEVASVAYKIARTKTLLDDQGKALVEEAKAMTKAVDADRKRIRDELDALKDEVRKPLDDFEQAEKDRVLAHEAALAAIVAAGQNIETNWQTLPLADMAYVVPERDWQEFAGRMNLIGANTQTQITQAIEKRTKHDAEQAELARLRAEQVAREQKERDQKIADEAAEKARLEAEAKAKAEAERQANLAEQARIEVERQKKEAEDRAAKAEADRIMSEKKAEADKIAAEAKAKQDAEIAAQAERDKIAAEQKAQAEAAAKREADLSHKKKINQEILLALTTLNGVLTDEAAKEIITAIAQGKIPHVKINY